MYSYDKLSIGLYKWVLSILIQKLIIIFFFKISFIKEIYEP